MKRLLCQFVLMLMNCSIANAQVITPVLPTTSAPLNPGYLSYSHNGKWASVVSRNGNNVLSYQVNCQTGSFGVGPTDTTPAGSSPTNLAYAPNDAFLAVASSGFLSTDGANTNVIIYRVDCATGNLEPIQTLASPTNPEILSPRSVAYSPDGRFAAVTNFGLLDINTLTLTNGNISVYRVNKLSGKWTHIQTLSYGSDGPQTVAYAPDGKSAAAVFISNSSTPTFAGRSFTVDPVTGLFSNSQLFTTSTMNLPIPLGLVYSHSEHNGVFYAAVTNTSAQTVATFTVNPATGVFTYTDEIAAPGARHVAYSRTDQVAAVTGDSTGNIYVYCVDQSVSDGGKFLLEQTYHQTNLIAPEGVAFAPCSDFMAVSDPSAQTQAIDVFRVNETTCLAP